MYVWACNSKAAQYMKGLKPGYASHNAIARTKDPTSTTHREPICMSQVPAQQHMYVHPLELIDHSPALLLPMEAFTAFYLISHLASILGFFVLYHLARH